MRAAVVLLLFAACGGDHITVTVPARLEQAAIDPGTVQSYELWVLEQVGLDSTPILCDDLMSRAIVPASPNTIVLARVAGSFDGSEVALTELRAGQQNRIFYVDMFDQPDQLGTRVGAGCTPSVTIIGGKRVTIEIAIDKP
ncbi:MAG: hypothetical protein IT381_22270 [Deltaproteobacteria bacterium]|nr:hypothetical protein [Deltaproteobacteria bacterium]